MMSRLRETVAEIRRKYDGTPLVGMVLGSGLGPYADTLEKKMVLPYASLPHFPRSTVLGHSGNLVLGEAGGVVVAAMQGRVHYYEGYSMTEVVYGVRILRLLGIRQLIITNAAGGVNETFRPGDLMLISDHINMMGANPLLGPNIEELGERFPDMSEAYSEALMRVARQSASRAGISLKQGVYLGLAGPSYETPAEIRMMRSMGADAVGMSTVPEVIAANHMGLRVLGISCITNMAAGILPRKLTHQEVMDTTEHVKENFIALLRGIIPLLPAADVRGNR